MPFLANGQGELWLKKYQTARNYFNAENPTAVSDSIAKALFTEIVESEPNPLIPDTIFADAYEKLGILYLIQNQPGQSILLLQSGVRFTKEKALPDTLLFASYLYLGESFFLQNQVDSSLHFLDLAEKSLMGKQDQTDTGRLYNSLGVIYYESGNFSQAVNYFSKAKSILLNKSAPEQPAENQYALMSLLSNEAAAWTNLKEFDKASALFAEALNLDVETPEIEKKLTSLYVKKEEPDTALIYLQRAWNDSDTDNRLYQNLLAEIFLLKGQPDRVTGLFDSLQEATSAAPTGEEPTTYNFRGGKSYQLLGKAWLEKGEYKKALDSFHKSLLYFDESFTQADTFQNPTPGNVNWGMTDLFETLVLKAKSARLLAKETNDVRFYDLTFETFQVAFDLVFYMNNLYDNQEARLFLGEAIRAGYESAVLAALERYEQTNQPAHLIQGFLWAEESKASALELAKNEARIKEKAGIPEELLQEEKALKFQLTRANRRLMENYAPEKAEELETAVRDNKLALSRLYASYNGFDTYFIKKLEAERIEFSSLQTLVNSGNLAILSYFMAEEDVFCFTLSPGGLKLAPPQKENVVRETIQALQANLLESGGKNRNKLEKQASAAYDQLIAAAYPHLKKYRSWVVLPDQLLVHLPFEMLIDADGKFLVENHALTYQYSGKLLQLDSNPVRSTGQAMGFAPFTADSNSEDTGSFNLLPYSELEMEALGGKVFTGNSATKTAFLNHSEDASLIHLATHAVTAQDATANAYIVFSPSEPDHLLRDEELYQLALTNTSLVFLSACETHTGKVMKSEGLISLSRGFSYAGCSNVVSSIWKANDKATSYLSRDFYRWIAKGYGYDVALQRAKIGLMEDPEMAQYRHPYFWANLVFIGNPTSKSTFFSSRSLFWFLFIALTSIAGWFFWTKKGKPKLSL
ncbi:CHAT domain-containing protein [Cyclobacterium jeungdonense]|uniref:CHAT domain-containing protein n=1 Tax=Cyclobacterium jeungdonense TaxID=708087 RepID=A0ABT8CC34_9BACT|nr:CHAT domain-containing protein [Cyclobacterium jeungdonense]MDN3689373.1 CHAT domain-containing protein [Cyclobacterium jeungdonense]